MTAAHEPNENDGPHEGPIKTPKQLILAVLYAFVVPIFGIVLLVMFVTADQRPSAGSDALSPKATAERIRPVARVEIKDATDVASMKTGEQVYAAQCTACHAAGALGAPKLGDTVAWAPRIKTGYEALLHSALVGKGQMLAQGGGDYSDYEIARAVVHMANQGGAKFAEPAAPVAAASAAAPTAAAPSIAAPAPAPMVAVATSTAPAATPAPAAPVVAKADAGSPPALYTQVCAVCHVAGVAGAPKIGDKAAWAPRIALGIDALVASVVKGKGAMPPKGGSTASDAEIKAVVTWMVGQAK